MNNLIVKLCANPGPAGPSWVRMIASLCTSSFSEYLSLKRAYDDPQSDTSLLAWRARNLLELSVWSIYRSRSREDELRLFADGGWDLLNLFVACEKWTAIVKKAPVERADLEVVEREKQQMAERAALQGIALRAAD